MTNLEWIRSLSAEEMSEVHLLFCPYEHERSLTELPCYRDDLESLDMVTQEQCDKCILAWLKEERPV